MYSGSRCVNSSSLCRRNCEQNGELLVNMGVNEVNSMTYRIKHSERQYISVILLQKVNCQIWN